MLKLDEAHFHKWTNNETNFTVKKGIQSRSWIIITNIYVVVSEKTLFFSKTFLGLHNRISDFTVFIHVLIFIGHYNYIADNFLVRNNDIPNFITDNNITTVDAVTLLAIVILHVIIVTVLAVLLLVVNPFLVLYKSSSSSLSLLLCVNRKQGKRRKWVFCQNYNNGNSNQDDSLDSFLTRLCSILVD